MTDKQLRALCAQWQRVLRLQDWDVSARFVRVQEMRGTWHKGNISYSLRYKKGRIKLLCREDWDESGVLDYDAEITLVHELLHLHLAPLGVEDDTAEDTAQETAIESVAIALVTLKRAAK